MRHALVNSLSAWGALLLPGVTTVRSEEPPAFTDAISREFTIFNRRPEPPAFTDAVSREFTIFNRHPEPPAFTDAVSREFTISAPAPDLEVTGVVVEPEEGLPGRPFGIAWRVTNRGRGGGQGTWVDRVYLSGDDQFGADTLLGTFSFEGVLEPGGHYDRSASFPFPEEPGLYWLFVVTNEDAQALEFEMANNLDRYPRPIRVQPPLVADLVVPEVIPLRDGVLAGVSTEVEFVVENESANATDFGSWVDSVFLTTEESLGADLSGEPYFLGQFPNPRVLRAGESYRERLPITLPDRVTGTFHLAVYTDSRKNTNSPWRKGESFDVLELDELNNVTFSAPFAIEAGDVHPDLEVRILSAPAIAFVARRFEVSWLVENTGSAAAAGRSWLDRVYLSENQNPSIDANDLRLCVASGKLDAPQTCTPVVPLDVGESFFLKVRADDLDAIWEPTPGGESNNVAVSSRVEVSFTPLVDLEASDVATPSTGVPGHEILVTWSVRKTGGISADNPLAWRDGIYLSVDATWDRGEDLLLGQFGHATTADEEGNIELPPYSSSESVRLPADIQEGTYFIVLVVDVRDEVFEGGVESNNWLASGSPLEVVRTSSDLALTVPCKGSPPVSGSAAAGQPLLLSWQVRNVGKLSTASPSWRDAVYFSRDLAFGAEDVLLTAIRHNALLGAGASYCREGSATVPLVSPGSYFLLFLSDADGELPEVSPEDGADAEANNLVALPFEVLDSAADLVITEVLCPQLPGAVAAGDSLHVGWTVSNQGTLATQASFWIDRVYLSTDGELEADDILVGSRIRDRALERGTSYTVPPFEIPLPAYLTGVFHLVVETDADGDVHESEERNNHQLKEPLLTVLLSPSARLVVSDIQTPELVVSGQKVCISWTVTNTGDGPTDVTRWRDSVYLSRDRYLDRTRDVFLGSYEREGALQAGESYHFPDDAAGEDGCFDVPLGVSGPYFVFVVTDSLEQVSGESGDSQDHTATPLDLVLPLPSDLAVAEVSPPASGVLGKRMEVRWSVENRGGEAVNGRWYDSLYLSADDSWDLADRLFGRFEISRIEPLTPGGPPHSALATAPVPAVKPGDYHVIVRADVFNQIPELDEGNNLGVSLGTVSVSSVPLVLDAAEPHREAIQSGQDLYFELTIPEGKAGETVRVDLVHDDPAAWTELYVSFEEVPTPASFLLRFDAPAQAEQSVKIPGVNAGRHYILARATAGGDGAVEVEAVTVPFSVEAVRPWRVGDSGRVTLTIEGSQFETGARVELEGAGGVVAEARGVEVENAARLRAKFLLEEPERGTYDLVVVNPGGARARLPGGVEIEAVVPPFLVVESEEPAALREGASGGTWDWRLVNRGNVDAEYVFLVQVIAEAPGREVVRVSSSSSYAQVAARDGLLLPSALAHGVAPGSSLVLSTTLRAGSDPVPGITVGQGIALLATEDFLRYERDAAEAVRRALRSEPSLARDDERSGLLALAEEPGAWRGYWFGKLEEAGLVDSEDLAKPGRGAQDLRLRGEVGCESPRPGEERAPLCQEVDERLCREWLARLVEIGVEASGDFAGSPGDLATSQLNCSLTDLTACTSCILWPVKDVVDPNEKEGPDGVGDDRFVALKAPINYRIEFMNLPSASGTVAEVEIRDPIDSTLNTGSFRLGPISFGGTVLKVPESESISFQTRVDLTATLGVFVDVTAGIDTKRSEARWLLKSIDPATGEAPTEASVGFLPPNDDSGAGLGSVEFSIEPDRSLLASLITENDALIRFHNTEIRTKTITHRIDAEAPASGVAPLPAAVEERAIDLSWSGADPEGGSGLSSYTLYVSDDGGPFWAFLADSKATSAVFVGEEDHTYYFYTIAKDYAGNEEEAPQAFDAWTRVRSVPRFRRGDANHSGTVDVADAIFTLGCLFLGTACPVCPDAADSNDDGSLDVSDPVHVLLFLFRGGGPPAPPYPTCGQDPSADGLEECRYPRETC